MAKNSLVEADTPFGIVPQFVMADKRLSTSARWLYAFLCTRASPDGWCRSSLSKIAKEQEFSRRAVQNWRRELEQFGYLIVEEIDGRSSRFCVIRQLERVAETASENALRISDRVIIRENQIKKRSGSMHTPAQPASQRDEPACTPPAQLNSHKQTLRTQNSRRKNPDTILTCPDSNPTKKSGHSDFLERQEENRKRNLQLADARRKIVGRIGNAEQGWAWLSGLDANIKDEIETLQLNNQLTDEYFKDVLSRSGGG